MKPTRRSGRVKAARSGLGPLVAEVRELVQAARRSAVSVVNTLQVLTNFEIGRRIVEHEQKGAKRAGYGTALLIELSERLTEEFGKGFSRTNLEYMRKFFLTWQDRVPMISQTVSGKLVKARICQTASGEFEASAICQTASGKSEGEGIGQTVSDQLEKSQTPCVKGVS